MSKRRTLAECAKALIEYNGWKRKNKRIKTGDLVDVTLEGIVVSDYETDYGDNYSVLLYDSNRPFQIMLPSECVKMVKANKETGFYGEW